MFSDDHYLISDQMIMQVTSLAPVVGYLGCFFCQKWSCVLIWVGLECTLSPYKRHKRGVHIPKDVKKRKNPYIFYHFAKGSETSGIPDL
jgi:hypothetical protein